MTISVVCEKQKDAEHFKKFSLRMKVVPLGDGEQGQPMTSCVLVSADGHESPTKLLADHRAMLCALANSPNRTAQRGDWLEKVKLKERTFDRRRDELLDWSFELYRGGRWARCLPDD